MSWWRYEKAKGRGFWLVSSEVSAWLFLILTVLAMLFAVIGLNITGE